MESTYTASHSPAFAEATASSQKRFARWNAATVNFIGIGIVAAVVAGFAFAFYAGDFRGRWRQLHHDRNTHYLQAIRFARELRSLDVPGFVAELLAARTWPPLHNLLSGVAMTVGGIGPRMAVIPDVVAFACTAIFAFAIARRLAENFGNVAGWTAAAFVLASPAHRIYSTDVMLESLGACLTLAAIWTWIDARSTDSYSSWRRCGLAMTALFLTKYNYWLLVILAIGGGEVVSNSAAVIALLHQFRHGVDWKAVLRYAIRQPLTVPTVLVCATTCWCLPRGGQAVHLFGRTVVIEDKCYNLLTVGLLMTIAWLLPWWLRAGRRRLSESGPAIRALTAWHFIPVVGWLALPKRLGYFVWYLSPSNGPVEPESALEFLPTQWQWWTSQYHIGVWSFSIAAVLAAIAILAFIANVVRRRAQCGTGITVVLLLLSALLTIRHPQHSDRYSHTWIAALWILAGAGLAQLEALPWKFEGRRLQWPAIVATMTIWLLHAPQMLRPGHSIDEGHQALTSARSISDSYLARLTESRRVTFLGTQPFGAFLQWSFLERFGNRKPCETFVKRFGRDESANDKLLQDWVESTPSDTVVTVDVPPGGEFYYGNFDHYRQYIDFMNRQHRFVPESVEKLQSSGVQVTVWKRVDLATNSKSQPSIR